MPDVWINLAHVHFAQGNFALAVKMVCSYSLFIFSYFSCLILPHRWMCWWACILQYENCLRKFYHNTDSQVLLYLARTHYEAEQWQDCKKTLLRAIHLAPSNYTLRFDSGVALQKFSASTLQKTKRTVDEVLWNELLLSSSPSSILPVVKLKWMNFFDLVPVNLLFLGHILKYL